ncbi:MAG TPA: BatA domain-containing protein [Phycisphaerae bacterium]|nr:BatA domain-containing protein [Phycisphaerae bacterium]
MAAALPVLGAFVYPGLFYAGAAAVAAPILIHILARRRFKRIRWAAIEFLIDAEKRNRRRVRLEQWVLLLMRCLAVLLIALVVSRPYLQPQSLAALLGGRERTERIFLLDDSYSMGYTAGDSTVFDAAKESLIRLIGWVHRQVPEDPVTVLRSSAPATPIAAAARLDDAGAEDLFARVRALHPSQRTLQLDDAVASVRRLLDESPEIVGASLCVVSDFQRTDWVERPAQRSNADAGTRNEGDGDATAASPLAPLADWAAGERDLSVVLVAVGDPDATNRSVADLDASRSPFVAGTEGMLNAVIANHGDNDLENVELEVYLGSAAAQTEPVAAIAARQTASVPLPVTFPSSGFEAVRVELPPDGLTVDDTRTAVATVNDAIRILVVNGEPSADPYRDEVRLLATALRPEGEVFSGNQVQVIDEAEFESTDLENYHLVVLANLYRVSDVAVEGLTEFVRTGGGLLVFLGDQVNAGLYNDALHAGGSGLLPVALDEIVQAPAAGVAWAEVDLLHPITRVFAGRDNPFLQRLTFNRYFRVRDERPSDDGSPSAVRDSLFTVLARFSDTEQTPAILERAFGSGRVMLVTTSCDLEWNNWGKDPSYVILLLDAVRYLARRAAGSPGLLVGAPIEIALDSQQYEPDALLRTPGYPAEAEIPITAVPTDDGRTLTLRWNRTDVAGLYRFVLRRRDPSLGYDDIRAVAVNPDPREGDLSITGEEDLRLALPGIPLEYFASTDALEDLDAAGRKELWPGFLIAALVVLLGEQTLAYVFGRRG